MRGPVAWLIEAALVAAVLVPVARSARVRGVVASLGRWRQVVLGAMLAAALAAQLALGTRLFPLVDWKMYSSLPEGDPVVFSYDVELAGGGGRDALVPGRFMRPESADRLMERLRRDVTAGDPAPALRALAELYESGTGHRVAAVVVSESTIAIASGERTPARERLRVPLP